MKAINNFELIKPLLEFPHENTFYFIQIIQRKKDHPGQRLGGSNNNSRMVKAYYIRSLEHLEVLQQEMITMAHVFNARVSINLNPRNYEKASYQLLQKVANQMSNKDFQAISKAYESICGEYHSEIDKRWIIDLDEKDMDRKDHIVRFIEEMHSQQQKSQYKIIAEIPSKSGMHIITNPFNLQEWNKCIGDIEVHKNNPSNAYIPLETLTINYA